MILLYMLPSYLLSLPFIAGILSLPITRKSPHSRLWHIFFPVFTMFHISVSWGLLILASSMDGRPPSLAMNVLYTLYFAFCCSSFPFYILYDLIPNRFIVYELNLEFNIPIALGSVLWSLALTMIIVFIKNIRRKRPQQAGPGYPPQGVGSPDP